MWHNGYRTLDARRAEVRHPKGPTAALPPSPVLGSSGIVLITRSITVLAGGDAPISNVEFSEHYIAYITGSWTFVYTVYA